jgi:hypothetical protein
MRVCAKPSPARRQEVADTPPDAGADASTEVDISVALDSDSDSPAGGGARFGVVRNAGVPRRAGSAWGGACAGAPSAACSLVSLAGGAGAAPVVGRAVVLFCCVLRTAGCKRLLRAGLVKAGGIFNPL